MAIRTDLALEAASGDILCEGIVRKERGEAFKITEITITDDKSGDSIGKKKGIYVTLEGDTLSTVNDRYQIMTEELADELKKFIGEKGRVLVVGLGNDDITPDALGPYAAGGVMATRHFKTELADDEFLSSLREVSVLVSGVLGTTGMESAEIVKAVSKEISFDKIIVIDALACSDISRLGKTIQISSAGISPGSGVQNRRKELSFDTLGVPVIAIGVPTVIDMHTVYENITGKEPENTMPDMMVTPKDIDTIISGASKMIAAALNLALQSVLSFEEAIELAH